MLWYLFALGTALFWGVENFLYKVSAERNQSSANITAVFGITSSIVAIGAYFIFGSSVSDLRYLLILSLINALFFVIALVTKLKALKKIAGTIFFSINRTGIVVLSVIFSFILLHESTSTLQNVGLIISIIGIYLLTREKKDSKKSTIIKYSLVLTAISTLFFALANLSVKFAAEKVDTFAYSGVVYIFIYILSLGYRQYTQLKLQLVNDKLVRKIKRDEYILGAIIGIFNVAGFVSFVYALKGGTLSIVSAVTNFSLLVTLALVFLIYKEKPSVQQKMGMLFALVALLLLR